jgi:hypothetical protein
MAALVILITPLLILVVWAVHAPRARPSGFWVLKGLLLFAALCPLPLAIAFTNIEPLRLSHFNIWTATIYAGTVLLPCAGGVALVATLATWMRGAGPWLRTYALAVSCSAIVVSAYLVSWGMVGFKTWDF